MTKLPDNTVAYCPIKSQNDFRNVCVLTPDALIITIKGKSKTYLLSNVVSISIKQKKMLFPIIAGGIIGSLFFIASFNFVINFWLSLSLSCLGFILFYYGWQGSPTISIRTKVKEYDHFINIVSKPLRLFIDFITMEVLTAEFSGLCFYLVMDKGKWDRQQHYEIEINQKTYLKTKSQLAYGNNEVVLQIMINKLVAKVEVEIRDGEIRPYIKENINLDAVALIN